VKALRKLLLRVFGKLLVALSWLFEGLGWLLAGVVSLLEPVGKLLVFVAALAGLIVGLFMLWDDWRGFPVAAAFTRVGGPTRVETAVDASRFWLRPPRCVVQLNMPCPMTRHCFSSHRIRSGISWFMRRSKNGRTPGLKVLGFLRSA
jgi:hypothetical protein